MKYLFCTCELVGGGGGASEGVAPQTSVLHSAGISGLVRKENYVTASLRDAEYSRSPSDIFLISPQTQSLQPQQPFGKPTSRAKMATGVDAKLLKSTKFPPEFNQKVDMQKVNLQVMKK